MFHEKLKQLRLTNNMTQKDVAGAIGISERVFGYYESGNRFPKSPDVLNKIADFFHVSVDYLLERSPVPNLIYSAPLSTKDYRQIEHFLEDTQKALLEQEGLMFDGEPASDAAIESIIDAMRFGMEQARKANKKYTPKKYRKGSEEGNDQANR